MIKIIMGQKGAGKTKTLIDTVNKATGEEKGNVVCVTNGNRLLFDLKSSVRLVDTSDFDLDFYMLFYGYLCGIISRDYDITHIFIDSVTKIVNSDFSEFNVFLEYLEKLATKFNISFTITISADVSEADGLMKKYLMEF